MGKLVLSTVSYRVPQQQNYSVKPGGICILAFACPSRSTVTSTVLALMKALRTVTAFT